MDDVQDIAHKIFGDNIKCENSINMQFDEEDLEYIFQVIVNIYLEGLKIKGFAFYVNDTLNLKLDYESLNIMSQYMKSIKFIPKVEILQFEESHTVLQNRYCNIVPESDGQFQFTINPIFYKIFLDNRKLSDFTAVLVHDKKLILLSFNWNN